VDDEYPEYVDMLTSVVRSKGLVSSQCCDVLELYEMLCLWRAYVDRLTC
jgi:hypothetical protein